MICDVSHGIMILTEDNSQLVYLNALAAPVLSGGPVSRDISGSPTTGCFPVSRDVSGSNQYCLAVLPSETSLERVEKLAKK
jgi:hypothetical protein